MADLLKELLSGQLTPPRQVLDDRCDSRSSIAITVSDQIPVASVVNSWIHAKPVTLEEALTNVAERHRAEAKQARDTHVWDAAKVAMAGLLADHIDHADQIQPGETCPQAVARLAFDFAEALVAEKEKREGVR